MKLRGINISLVKETPKTREGILEQGRERDLNLRNDSHLKEDSSEKVDQPAQKENKAVEWVEEIVTSDDTLAHLLNDHRAAVKMLFGHETRPGGCSDVQWKNHLFAQKALVVEICACATGGDILNMMQSDT